MTVKYAGQFATNSSFGCFIKLLFRWRGSVYKLVGKEYAIFITLYYIINLTYRHALNDDQRRVFEKLSNYCDACTESFAIMFVLGFFVTSIVSKWWKMYDMIPWPDPIAYFVHAGIRDEDETSKLLKQAIVRHCCLSLTLTSLSISTSVQRRYPTLDHLIQEGMLTEEEKVRMKKMDKSTSSSYQWLPLSWTSDLIMEAEKQGKVHPMFGPKIIDLLDKFRQSCALLLEYEQWSVPLAYIQVVTISVYTYFAFSLFGGQWLYENDKLKNFDLYFPFFASLEFIFYMGWLKVAESIINPFGCDDDDFELDQILVRHFQVTQAMVSATDDERFAVNQTTKDNNVHAYFVNEAFSEDSDDKPKPEKMSSQIKRQKFDENAAACVEDFEETLEFSEEISRNANTVNKL